MKKIKVFLVIFMLIILACTFTGCKKTEKKEEQQKSWIEDMKKVSYIQTSGYSGEKNIDNELAKIILSTYTDKTSEESTFLANEDSEKQGNMFYFYDENNTILYQIQCDFDGYHGNKICVMEVHKTDEKYTYDFHTFDCPNAVQYINNVLKPNEAAN